MAGVDLKAVKQRMKLAGLYLGGRVPRGTKVSVRGGFKMLVPDDESRAFTAFVFKLRNDKLTWRQIGDECERRTAEHEGRKPRPWGWHRFKRTMLGRAYQQEIRLRAEEERQRRLERELHETACRT